MTTKQMLNYMADIDGFRGVTRDGSGVWYVSFLCESKFWSFLSRNSRFQGEPITWGTGSYTFKNTTDMDKTLKWLVKEHKLFTAGSKKGKVK
jgi:hypothetical protein